MSHDHLEYPSPNWSTRGGHRVRALVIHTTAGAWSSDRDWLCNPVSKVSAHYIIAPDGVSYQLVDEAHAAWANGILDKPNLTIPIVAEWRATPIDPDWPAGLPNLESVSIEVSALMGAGWTAPQRSRVIELGRVICRRHGIPVTAILRHSDITNTACPGLTAGSWRALVMAIGEGLVVPPDVVDLAFDAYAAAHDLGPALWSGTYARAWAGSKVTRYDRAVLAWVNGQVVNVTARVLDDWETAYAGEIVKY